MRFYLSVKNIFEVYIKYREVIIVFKEAAIINDRFENEWQNIRNSIFTRVAREMRWCIKNNLCRPFDEEVVFLGLANMWEGVASYLISQNKDNISADRMAQGLADICVRSIFITEEIPVEVLQLSGKRQIEPT